MRKKISAVINTYNAAKYLDRVLTHLEMFDEIVVCDMESTDETLDIARRHSCRIVTFPKGEHKICEPARDFAIHSASNEWVFVVDADELVPRALAEYLYSAINDQGYEGAFDIPRINMFMGEQFTERADRQLRFFRKGVAFWPPTIHSHPQLDCEIREIPMRRDLSLIHLENPDTAQRIAKLNNYTDYDALRRIARKFNAPIMLLRPLWFFFRAYVMQGEIRHGRKGILSSYFSMIYQVALMAKIFEHQNPDVLDTDPERLEKI